MEPDQLNLNYGTLYIDGQEVGKIDNLNIESMEVSKNTNDTNFDFNKSFEGYFILKGENRRKLFRYMYLNLENIRLIRIFIKTKKLRVKKKLAGRINRNIYELMYQ
jgi:hypothetical protein